MFFREKKAKNHSYLQIVENNKVNGQSRQRVIANIGRLDELQESGKIDDLIASGARFSERIMVLNAHREGTLVETSKKKIGGPLVFDRIWREIGCYDIIRELTRDRKIQFNIERAIFSTVLHRLFDPGSDRACEKWMNSYAIKDGDDLRLQHFYRAMAWLGEEQEGRPVKDRIEEELFHKNQDLFSKIDMVFFDTTSIYFEGEGGETIGQYGHSKDHRPDLKQMVVGAVLDQSGHPVCCELWPGNMADVKSLQPVSDRLKKRFGIKESCIVADRGMISGETLDWLETGKNKRPYILGARMRRQKEVSEEVLTRAGRYEVIYGEREKHGDPSPLKVKEVWVGDNRYIVCHNEDQAEKDRKDRELILKSLEESLKKGSKTLVGNKGFRKYLKSDKHFEIDMEKVKEEERYDGKWVLRTNTTLSAREVALKYKQLWMVEDIFRSLKSLLDTRPIYHKCDETIRGHVFCSFLAMILMKELKDRMDAKGQHNIEWYDVIHDLDNLEELELEQAGKHFSLRIGLTGCAGKVFQAVGAALPPTVRRMEKVVPTAFSEIVIV
jgi:Transposase